MIDPDIVLKLKDRYNYLHPLLFHRSVERAKDVVELFDILDSVPTEVPITWCNSKRRWQTTVLFEAYNQSKLVE